MSSTNLATVLLAGCGLVLTIFPGGASAADWFRIQGTEPPGAKVVKVWGFLQPTYYYSTSDLPPDEDFRKNDFDIRRARFGLRGIVPNTEEKINYFFLTEWGRNGVTEDPNGGQSDSAYLTDASVTLNYIPGAHLRFGQFKLPIGNDGLKAIQLHTYINFSDVYFELLLTRFGADRSVGSFRGIGGESFGWFPFGKDHQYEVAYAVMVDNGNGINSRDNNDNKRVTANVNVARIFDDTSGPFRQNIQVGAWYMTGDNTGFDYAPGPANGAPVTSRATRGGVELIVEKNLGSSGAMHFITESVWGSGWVYAPHFFDGAVPLDRRLFTDNTSVDGHGVPQADLDAWGYYLDGGYRPPIWNEKVELDVRYSYYDPDAGEDLATSVSQDSWTFGVQYIFSEKARLIFNYELRDNAWNPGVGNLYGVQITAVF